MTSAPQDLSHLSVLAAYAHPDDEGFASGGTLAMLVSRGAKVTLICATNGDVGEISDSSLATPETLGQVRQAELRRAMQVTGISDVRFLNYRDSGMVGTADNSHPNSLNQASPDRVVEQLRAVMRDVRPNLVITHDPSGGYGHPDHKAVCRHATTAFSLTLESEITVLPVPSLLYYVCFPRSIFRRMWRDMLDHGISPPFASMDVETLGTPDEEVTTTLGVGQYVDTKIASLNCHQTQISPSGPFAKLPEEKVRELMSTEYFLLALPEGVGAQDDLLGGLK